MALNGSKTMKKIKKTTKNIFYRYWHLGDNCEKWELIFIRKHWKDYKEYSQKLLNAIDKTDNKKVNNLIT